jgi:hypothetical protein
VRKGEECDDEKAETEEQKQKKRKSVILKSFGALKGIHPTLRPQQERELAEDAIAAEAIKRMVGKRPAHDRKSFDTAEEGFTHHSKAGDGKLRQGFRPTSSGAFSQPEPPEGRTQAAVVRQLAMINNRYGFLAIAYVIAALPWILQQRIVRLVCNAP